jgi:hypothetical protein
MSTENAAPTRRVRVDAAEVPDVKAKIVAQHARRQQGEQKARLVTPIRRVKTARCHVHNFVVNASERKLLHGIHM